MTLGVLQSTGQRPPGNRDPTPTVNSAEVERHRTETLSSEKGGKGADLGVVMGDVGHPPPNRTSQEDRAGGSCQRGP